MSALSNLAGLYPPIKEQIWNPNLLWQPIPVHTTPKAEDNILSSHAECPTFQKRYKELMMSDEIQGFIQKFCNATSCRAMKFPRKRFLDPFSFINALPHGK